MGTRSYYVYILASRIGGTLYSFTKDYDVNRLMYFECFDEVEAAIQRENG
jgi:putative endonuclease